MPQSVSQSCLRSHIGALDILPRNLAANPPPPRPGLVRVAEGIHLNLGLPLDPLGSRMVRVLVKHENQVHEVASGSHVLCNGQFLRQQGNKDPLLQLFTGIQGGIGIWGTWLTPLHACIAHGGKEV
jgi:hypothetical protein